MWLSETAKHLHVLPGSWTPTPFSLELHSDLSYKTCPKALDHNPHFPPLRTPHPALCYFLIGGATCILSHTKWKQREDHASYECLSLMHVNLRFSVQQILIFSIPAMFPRLPKCLVSTRSNNLRIQWLRDLIQAVYMLNTMHCCCTFSVIKREVSK